MIHTSYKENWIHLGLSTATRIKLINPNNQIFIHKWQSHINVKEPRL